MVGQSYVRVFVTVHEGPGSVVWQRTRDLPWRIAVLQVGRTVGRTLSPIRDSIDAQVHQTLWQMEHPA